MGREELRELLNECYTGILDRKLLYESILCIARHLASPATNHQVPVLALIYNN